MDTELWLGLFNQLLFIYRDTKIPKPISIEEFLADASKLYDFITAGLK